MTARGGACRLSLLLFTLLFVVVAAGCRSNKSSHRNEEQTVFAVRATDPSATRRVLRTGAESLVERLALLGVPRGEIRVQRQGGDLTVQFPERLARSSSLRRVARQPMLEVYDLENDLAAASKTADGDAKPETSLYALLAPEQQQVEFRGADGWELFNATTKQLVAGPAATPEALFRTRVAKLRQIKPGKPPYVVFGIPKKTVVVSCGTRAIVCPPGVAQATERTWYLFTHQPVLTGSDVTSARSDLDPTQGSVVLVGLDGDGARKLRDITRTLYQRGQLEQQSQHIAVVVDCEIRSMPQIDFKDATLANGITGSSLQVAVLRSPNEARQLALALEPLPVQFTRIR